MKCILTDEDCIFNKCCMFRTDLDRLKKENVISGVCTYKDIGKIEKDDKQ